jgi:hypothetical protein
VVVGSGIALALGPVVGIVLIFATDAPLALVNIVSGLVYALAMPFVALTTAYVYHDAVVRERLDRPADSEPLPSELSDQVPVAAQEGHAATTRSRASTASRPTHSCPTIASKTAARSRR